MTGPQHSQSRAAMTDQAISGFIDGERPIQAAPAGRGDRGTR
jgi:hypothetical protein